MVEKRENVLQNLKQELDAEGFTGKGKARKWIIEKIRSLKRKPISKRVLASQVRKGRASAAQIRGKMYFFNYDPKTKKKLPYYDTFPMIIILEIYKDGFLGVNLHYLPIKLRMNLLSKFMKLLTKTQPTEKSLARVRYKTIMNFAKYRGVKPCIKRYLSRHVKSQIVEIPATEWEIAAALPLARFKKEKESVVHRESTKNA